MKHYLIGVLLLFSLASSAQFVPGPSGVYRLHYRLRSEGGMGFSPRMYSPGDSSFVAGLRNGTISTGVSSWTALSDRPTLFSGNYSDLAGKPTLFSGAYADLSGKPSLFSGAWADLTGKPSTFTPSAHTHLATEISLDATHRFVTDAQIAGWNSGTGSGFSGSYTDLINRPNFATVATSGSYTDLANKPSLFSGAWVDVTGKPNFATVATSGSYNDLLNKPSLFSGAWADITGKPTFATVATSGSYNDLLNKPTIPTALTVTTNGTSGVATYAGGVLNIPSYAGGGSATTDASQLTSGILSAARLPALTGDLTSSAGTGSLTLNSILTAGTVGSASAIPIITYDAKGRITGVSSTTFSASGGGSFAQADARNAISGASGVNYSKTEGIATIDNGYVNTLIDNRLKSYDGYDPLVSKVLSTTGSSFKWVPAVYSESTVSAQSPRDTVLLYADSTLSRVNPGAMSTVTLTTEAQIRTFLTSAQTNVNATVADGTYVITTPLGQTGNWTNVWFHAATKGGVHFQRTGGSTAFIYTNTHTINRVKVDGFKFSSTFDNAGAQAYALYFSNELVTIDGLETVNCEITSNSIGSYNGWNMEQYSQGSSSGAIAKNIWFHANYVHHVGRANEILSQGYDYPRIIGLVISNNRFEYMGTGNQYGFGASKSGLIKGILEINNRFIQNRGISSEFVNTQYALSTGNFFSTTGSNVVVGYGISDDNVGSTKYLYFENATMNVTGRPFYVYGSKYVNFSGGTYTGRYGVDMTGSNNSFKNMTVNVWDNVSSGGSGTSFAWQIDLGASNNTLDNVSISSANTIANGGLYAREVLVVKGSNNTIKNSTLTQGKQANGTYYGYTLANSGANNTLTNNTLAQGN
jgi:hypothetical protein